MCGLWKKEKANHHFPELNKRGKLLKSAWAVFNWKRTMMALVSLSIVFGVAYLMQTNNVATRGYQIQGLQNKIRDLKTENEKLQQQYVRLQSMSNVISQASGLNMVAVEKMEVVSNLGSAVALK